MREGASMHKAFLIAMLAVATGAAVVTSLASAASSAGAPIAWERWLHVAGILDLAGPRSDGNLVIAARGRLKLLHPSGAVSNFAPRYSVPEPAEPYIALSPGVSVAGAGCEFPRDQVFALDLRSHPQGVWSIARDGSVAHLATVTKGSSLSGIALDAVGDFGHKLLVTARRGSTTALLAVDCRGGVKTIQTV